ncbi:MAG: DUF4258 domain-containing protein [Deltaproteobacteria bacterium]
MESKKLDESTHIIYRTHAVKRMFQRNVNETDVRNILMQGETIEAYVDDKPYPSRLILGWISERPIHVVAADNAVDNEIIVVTVYEPDTEKWSVDFKRRIL